MDREAWCSAGFVTLGSQRVGHDWVSELNWTENVIFFSLIYVIQQLHFKEYAQEMDIMSTWRYVCKFHSSFFHNSTELERIHMSSNHWVFKWNVFCVCSLSQSSANWHSCFLWPFSCSNIRVEWVWQRCTGCRVEIRSDSSQKERRKLSQPHA